MRIRTALLAAAAIGLAACATPEQDSQQTAMTPSEGRDCFRAASVSGYSIVDDNNIRVHVGPARSYTMHTTWNARDLDWTLQLALRSDTGWICTGRVRGAVEITDGTLARTYPIETVTRDPDPPGQQGS